MDEQTFNVHPLWVAHYEMNRRNSMDEHSFDIVIGNAHARVTAARDRFVEAYHEYRQAVETYGTQADVSVTAFENFIRCGSRFMVLVSISIENPEYLDWMDTVEMYSDLRRGG